MERETGLSRLKRIRQFADATLAIFETIKNVQPRLIREGMEDLRNLRLRLSRSGRHASLVHQVFLICQRATGMVAPSMAVC